MYRLLTLFAALFILSCIAKSQVIPSYEADTSCTFNQEIFQSQENVIVGTGFLVTGVILELVGIDIQQGYIDTPIHPANLKWPGTTFIGVGIACYMNGWLHFRNAKFIGNENGLGIVFRLNHNDTRDVAISQ